jgi:hypothetical protein
MCAEPNPATVDLKSRDLRDARRHTAIEATPFGEKDENEQSASPQQRERNRHALGEMILSRLHSSVHALGDEIHDSYQRRE